jgi:hypothetical protein
VVIITSMNFAMRRTAFTLSALLLLASLPACAKCDVPTWSFWGGEMTACSDKSR